MGLHVMHFAMKALGQPLRQPRLGRGQVHTGHTDLGKSQRLRPGCYRRNQLTAADHTSRIVESANADHASGSQNPHAAQARPSPAQASLQLLWSDEDDTAAFALQLASLPQLSNAYVTLHGDLGAGKTTLVRHWLRALGVQGRIKSPTYAVVEPHEAPALAIWHFDFYRFDDPREWEDAGFRDIFASPGLKLAEWPEKAATMTPVADIAIYIEAIDELQRQVRLDAYTDAGCSVLKALKA